MRGHEDITKPQDQLRKGMRATTQGFSGLSRLPLFLTPLHRRCSSVQYKKQQLPIKAFETSIELVK
ncbi:hypothetical protein HDZ31DRAFT_61996 [Schizophyllum fasciatum]